MELDDRLTALTAACAAATTDPSLAGQILAREYPLASPAMSSRRWTETTRTQVFLRDGFRDRYSGDPVVFPGALRLLSALLGDAFPFHPNWRTAAIHPAYWAFSPDIDHIVPIAEGGADEFPNVVTCSAATSSRKANFLPEQVGLELRDVDGADDWDGLTGWFVESCNSVNSDLLPAAVKSWAQALQRARSLPSVVDVPRLAWR